MNRKSSWLLPFLLPLAVASLIALASLARAQNVSLPRIPAETQNTSLLKLPQGAKLAIVVFQDLECPQCSVTHPLLEKAAQTYKIPLVQYDFPIAGHEWSFEAAVNARYFASQSTQLGEQYRSYVFHHQAEVTKSNLRGLSEKFAAEHKTVLPFVVDPQGKFAAAIRADQNLGERVGIHHTPTIYLVTNRPAPNAVVEVQDQRRLYQMIEGIKSE